MKRFKHSLSHYKLATLVPGKLIPVSILEALPGDTFQMSSQAMIRVSPLLAPVMHPVSVRMHHWFVPNRLLWDGWEDFITGGPDGIGGSSGAFPTISAGAGFAAKSLADYFGIPPSVANLLVSALPFRAYGLIFNEFYRDEDLVTERVVSTGSGADTTTDRTVASCAWEKDYFTSARPWPQKGPDVTLPLGTEAPVIGDGTSPKVHRGAAEDKTLAAVSGVAYMHTGTNWTANGAIAWGTNADASQTGLVADLSTASAVNVNDVRRAFAIQRYQEARAMYGSRYTEYLRYLGVRSSDARLQRPEYLGGGKQTIAFSEVLQTAPTTDGDDTVGVGNLKGHGIGAMRSRTFRRFFEEHGQIVSLMSVRPRTMYANGVHRSWLRRTKEDFWQKELERIGQQEIFNSEVFAADPATTGLNTFGYQDRYADYRHHPSTIAGDFRSTLDFWHLARVFASAPALNASFVTCDPADRIYAVPSEDQLWAMIAHSVRARRMVAPAGVGRIL